MCKGLRVDEVGLTGQNKAAAPDDDLFSQQETNNNEIIYL